jgi:hypothetical protein
MADNPPRRTSTTQRLTGSAPRVSERTKAVQGVLEQAAAIRRTTRTVVPPPARGLGRRLLILGCVVGLGFTAYTLIAQPAFLYGRREVVRAPVVAEANDRMVLYFIALRLAEYHDAEGEYPGSLGAIGLSSEGVSYSLVGDTGFVLGAMERGRPLVLRSGEDLKAFAGASLNVLRGAR